MPCKGDPVHRFINYKVFCSGLLNVNLMDLTVQAKLHISDSVNVFSLHFYVVVVCFSANEMPK